MLGLAQVPNTYTTREADLPCLDRTFGLRVLVNADDTGPNPFSIETLDSMVVFANKVFADICVGFEICEVVEVPNYRYSSYQRNDAAEQVSLYGDPNRIDVFITVRDSFQTECSHSDSAGILNNTRSSIMLVASCMDSTTQILSHELGHYFGLVNTNDIEAGKELVDGSNCATIGDRICDTPADPFNGDTRIQWVANDDPCRFVFRGLDENRQYYVPHTGNVMSEYDHECFCGFTHDQLARMAATIELAVRVW